MNFLDLAIIAVTIAATVRGVGSGLLRQIGSLGGFVLGMVIGTVIAPAIAGWLPLTANRPVVVLIIFFGVALTISGLGETLGGHGAGLMERIGLEPLDGALGAGFGFGAALLSVWLLASTFGATAGPIIADSIQNSRVLHLLDQALPPAPDVTAKLERAIGASRFPKVFAGLEPSAAPPVTGPNTAEVNAAVAAAGTSTVKIEGSGCGGIVEGSGFVVDAGLVATNAHVVAGIMNPYIYDANGRHRATVVGFDPDLDLAVLRTTGLAGPPLAIDPSTQTRGTTGAALGFPGGGPFTAGAAAILNSQTALGRNIYDSGLIHREIYSLQAVVRPGNSGGPLVLPSGTVIGVIFATSTSNPDLGYALTSAEIIPDITAAKTSGRVSTGECVAG